MLDRWSETSSKLNLVILGENGLADELANEIRVSLSLVLCTGPSAVSPPPPKCASPPSCRMPGLSS